MQATPIRSYRHDISQRPFIVIWEMTQACPLACLHCRAEARPDRHPGELTAAEARDLVAQVTEFGSPPPVFVLTGGDPFQRPDLFDLVRHGTRLGLPVAVSPSGTPTLTVGQLAGLRDAGARAISLSLDGSTAEVHDRFRGVPGVFGWTLDAWRAARELGLKVQINTTVTGHNLADLADIAALVNRLGAVSWSAFLLVPTGRGALLPALTARQAEDVLNFVYDAGEFVPARTTEAHHFRRIVIQREILRRRGADHVAALGLSELYLRLRQRLGGLGLARRRTRRPPANVNAGQGPVRRGPLVLLPARNLPVPRRPGRDGPAASHMTAIREAGMETESLAAALEREHHEIDAGIAAFDAAPGNPQPLTRAIAALRRHIYLEEEFLFPLLCQAEPGLAAPVFVMLREHAQMWAVLDSLEREPGDGTRLVLCRQLTVRLLHHNLKEEKVLYPRADDALPPAAADRLRAFLGSGKLPEGWVGLKARPVTRNAGR